MHIMTTPSALALALPLASVLSSAQPTSETPNLTAGTPQNDSLILIDPWPAHLGFRPHSGQQTPWLRKRECLGNGTNFCFGDRGRFCPDCGGCCDVGGETWCCRDEAATCCPGETCCGADERCCGGGCCPKGRRCLRGRCEAPV